MQRTGRSGHAMFRIIVQDSRRTPTSGKLVAQIGHYDPHQKTITLDKDKAKFYLEHGAQPSPRVVKILKIEDVKLPKWVTEKSPAPGKLRNPDKLRKNRPAEEKAPEPLPIAETAPEATEIKEDLPAIVEAEEKVPEADATPPEETEPEKTDADDKLGEAVPAEETPPRNEDPKSDEQPAEVEKDEPKEAENSESVLKTEDADTDEPK
ncbi:MAG TPA: 30S ribosomal protein S16 [Candidatus Saccharimonadales bacterium]|nr:30S ribosomal protein S16 [Candidatus Saccharimonadales bacterium]